MMMFKPPVAVDKESGFTLIEMLIVIIVLGILAMIIVPQITVSTEDAKVKTLQTNLSGIRSALEIYYAQHNNKYPGQNDTAGVATSVDLTAATAFVQQLTQYTSAIGAVNSSKGTTWPYGPYIRGGALPSNPFTETTTLVAVAATTSIIATRTIGGTQAWRVFPATGVIFANDSTVHAAY
ncbi:MAG: prepilin-type N-terminal cleavage/methylation domain-containing protein [Desulfobacterales bacterium]|nr:prepilin-type N-terminal cleavage/methylation domain-containing protein [Desulfobacterales bacterium]